METISFLGIAVESGQDQKGLRQSAIEARKHFPVGMSYLDLGDVLDSQDNQKIHWLRQLREDRAHVYEKAQEKIVDQLKQNHLHINWGGDHSIGLSTVSAFKKVHPDGVVLWIDAHADLNIPESSMTGNLHGMPLSFLLGLNAKSFSSQIKECLKPRDLIYLGLRSVDFFESEAMERLGIHSFDMSFIRQNGILKTLDEIQALIKGRPLHLSFDIDSLDPRYAPSTGIQVKGGLSPVDLRCLASYFACSGNTKSIDIVEINPCLGTDEDVQQTYDLAFDFLNPFFLARKSKLNLSKSVKDLSF